MLIKDIPYLKVKQAAIDNCDDDSGIEDHLSEAFVWEDTAEQNTFWMDVDESQWDQAKKLRPELFIKEDVDYKAALCELVSVIRKEPQACNALQRKGLFSNKTQSIMSDLQAEQDKTKEYKVIYVYTLGGYTETGSYTSKIVHPIPGSVFTRGDINCLVVSCAEVQDNA